MIHNSLYNYEGTWTVLLKQTVHRGYFQKVMLRESTEPKLNTRVLRILFICHGVTKVSSINIFFLMNGVRIDHCTNIVSYQLYIKSIKIFILQFSINQNINTNSVCHGVTKFTKSIFAPEQLTNFKQFKTSLKNSSNSAIQNPQMVYSSKS